MTKIGLILLLLGLLTLTVFTAASEIAIIAVSRLKLKRLAAGGSRKAKVLLKILETPERFFSTILVANNIVNTLIASIVTVVLVSFFGRGGEGVVIATVFVSLVIIVCEVVAKTLAATNSEKLSLILVTPVQILINILSPVVRILAKTVSGITRFLGGHVPKSTTLITEEEIRTLINIGSEQGSIHKDKVRLLTKVFEFSDAIVKDVMRPIGEMASVNISDKIDDVVNYALESGYSRFPVYKDNPDNIVGILNMKNLLLLLANKDLVVLQDIVYPATFVPETKKVSDLLRDFQKGHTHLAIVVDQNNKKNGIITLEDLLEEIVGEIEDELDVKPVRRKK